MAKRIPLPGVDLVREILHYDPDTGLFTWRVTRGGLAKAGGAAGCKKPCGHVVIKISGVAYMAHRLAWLVMTGADPDLDPDHKNGVPLDNTWENLRPATFTQNKANSRTYKNNKSGYKGVSWNKREQAWVAQISLGRKVRHLGYFTDPKEAHDAYATAARENFGEYARLS